ncbi:MAG: hypothetical protein A2788_00375 [Candidatus Abawacabacteria bacterium RIFCSPHIGHO2_01_FULL_46_8]|uniref:Small basic protein n=1 Tax=Candidatus Abawacabacteria bacterium RIFCSPHIGHO2_01_FULL_46_8 TaxID=1817815 RepID=A0A1F4XM21_9BACT|nr:MAG: hypothetical protein A2788_00375 [Candidatus Abawacabacteria bacterium RIFCSPHIGHO2_01_FULL_46_8]
MRWLFYGLVVGLILGIVLEIPIPVGYVRYTAVAIIGILDSIIGAIRADVYGPISHDDRKYDFVIFFSGLIFNVFLAVAITWLGDQLGVDLYLAAVIAFTLRIFKNLGYIRRIITAKLFRR